MATLADAEILAPVFDQTVTKIRQLPIEYDQQINILLDHMEYNVLQARALCEVADSMGELTTNAKDQIAVLRDAVNTIIATYSLEPDTFVGGDTNGTFAIFRPYYSDWKTVLLMPIVIIDFTNFSLLDSATSTRADYISHLNNMLEQIQDSKLGA